MKKYSLMAALAISLVACRSARCARALRRSPSRRSRQWVWRQARGPASRTAARKGSKESRIEAGDPVSRAAPCGACRPPGKPDPTSTWRRANTELVSVKRRDQRSRQVFTSSPFPASAPGRKNALTPSPVHSTRSFLSVRCGVAPDYATSRRIKAPR